MSMKIELREYQKESVKEVISSLSRGLRTLLSLPTGAGKTLVAKEVVDEYLNAGLTVLWITHRCELKSQVLGVFGENARFEVCLVKSRSSLKKVDLIVVDEAHHSAAPSYRSHFKQFPKAKVFGLSATPVRLDGKSLKDYFDIIIQPRSALTCTLIAQGFLADIELFIPDSKELNLCGEVIANSLNVEKSVLDGLKFIEGRKGITFCVNKAHALAVAEEFQKNGIEAEAVDSETPYDDRMKLADRWNENKIQVVVNCELYTEGTDLPGVDFVQILRPTESLSLYFQMIGRGMRSGPPMRLLDHTSNWKTIGLPKDDFIFTLDAANEAAYFKLADEAKKIRREKQSDTQPEHVDIGDLVEFNLHDWYGRLKESRSIGEIPIDDSKHINRAVKKSFSARIEEDIYGAIDAYCREHGISQAQFVERGAKSFFSDKDNEPKNNEPKNNELKLATFRVQDTKWAAFQTLCKDSGSNASKELIGFITGCLESGQVGTIAQSGVTLDDVNAIRDELSELRQMINKPVSI